MESPSLNSLVTILHNGPPTIERSDLGGIVTILHGQPPTTKTAKITKIVTILHNSEIPSLLRMRIIITPTGVGNRENENHYHSQGERGGLLRMRIIIIPRLRMGIILTREK
jgi:hypothetical protein